MTKRVDSFSFSEVALDLWKNKTQMGEHACHSPEKVKRIEQALREVYAMGLLDGVDIGGISPEITARRRAAAIQLSCQRRVDA